MKTRIIAAAVLTEYVFDAITKRGNTVTDGSAILTGLLLALTLPANVPVYIPVLGAVFAILVVKCLFGGLGHNIMNPALAGRSFLLISFGTAMTGYTLDGVSAATPLAELASGKRGRKTKRKNPAMVKLEQPDQKESNPGLQHK